MSNHVEIVAADGGQVKVTVRSDAERDLSAHSTREEIIRQLDAADASRPGETPAAPDA